MPTVKPATLLMSIGLLSVLSATAQVAPAFPRKTVDYIAPDGHLLPGPEGADHRVERTYRDSLSGVERIYSAKGVLKRNTPYGHLGYRIKLGPETTFYEDGELHTKEDYVANKRNGEFVVYYPNGQMKRRETYVADVRQTGDCFSPDGSPMAFFEYNVLPTYKGGGPNKIVQALAASVHYPVEALRANTQGRVFIAFRVGVNGQVDDIKVVKGVSAALDAAAIAAVKKLGSFEPGTQDGHPVAVSITFPVTFTIVESPPTHRAPYQNSSFGSSGIPY